MQEGKILRIFTARILKAYILIAMTAFAMASFLLAFPAECEDTSLKPPAVMSLKDAVNLAFMNNKAIQIQEEELAIARARIMGATSGMLPKANLNAGYTYNGAILRFPQALLQAEGTKKDVNIFSGYENNNSAGMSATETVFDGGATIANIKQAKLGLKVQEETLKAVKLNVEFEAKRLYYGLLLAYETSRIAQDLFDQAQAHYLDAKTKFEQGTVSKFDVLQSKVQVTKVMPELVKARNAIDLIKTDLKKLLGINMEDDIVPSGILSYSLVIIDEGAFLKEAYKNKPEMILRLLGIDIKKWAIETAKASAMPQVNASFDYTYLSNNPSHMFTYKHSNWNAGVAVTIPIFDGFSTVAKINEARHRYAQAILEKDDVRDQIVVDVRQACLDLKESNSIINSQKSGIEEAKEALKISYISFDNGVGTNLDVLDAQVSLSQIEKNLAEAIYDYIMAGAFLDKTLGRLYKDGRP
jgi:outer membrane protein